MFRLHANVTPHEHFWVLLGMLICSYNEPRRGSNFASRVIWSFVFSAGNITVCFSRERFTGLEVGQPEIDQDTPGKAFVYFTAMVSGNRMMK